MNSVTKLKKVGKGAIPSATDFNKMPEEAAKMN